MSRKPILALIGGARPNFVKLAPLYHHLRKRKVDFMLINTGQHFDKRMSQEFFKEFRMRAHAHLSPRHDSMAKQLSDMLHGLERTFQKNRPDAVIVVGDVNSTLAGALVANRLGIPLVHVEAGLRSHNKWMPEETNRIIIDRLSELLLVTEEGALTNLEDEGLSARAVPVGNIMMDTLTLFLPKVRSTKERFYFATLHRPENVDDPKIFRELVRALEAVAKDAKIYFALHPRTEKKAVEFGLLPRLKKACTVLPPLSYADTLFYQKNAALVLTDSGGIQEETSFLGTPCLTLRTETERPITVTLGTNIIGGITKASIIKAYRAYKKRGFPRAQAVIPMWDGKAAERITDEVLRFLEQKKVQ